MLSRLALIALAGCAPAAASPGGDVLRLLSGDATTIEADWTAREGGHRFAVVRDGAPVRPAISDHHAFGARGLAFEVPTDTSGHKQRVEYKLLEAAAPDGLHFDNARYIGFAFQLAAKPAPFLGSAIFCQAWQGFPYGPPVSLKLVTDDKPPYRIKLAIRDTATGPDSKNPDIELWSDRRIDPGAWHTFLLYLEPRVTGTGHIKLWIDREKVVDWSGPFGYDPAKVKGAYAGLDLKTGIYQPDANNGHTFYFDQIVVTTTYEAAASALGWVGAGSAR
ncbi:MAG TPA: heparin lyase I family protein [Kofleriaceae bacterium]|nr:heparin lyase I family protein [Kofleriaceae bacterium]